MKPPVRYPAMRREVVEALTYLSNPTYQRDVWLKDTSLPAGEFYAFDWAIHTLYDDADFEDDSTAAIGDVLCDHEEAEAIDRLMQSLEAVFAEVGSADAPIASLLSTREWSQVIEAARVALRTLVE